MWIQLTTELKRRFMLSVHPFLNGLDSSQKSPFVPEFLGREKAASRENCDRAQLVSLTDRLFYEAQMTGVSREPVSTDCTSIGRCAREGGGERRARSGPDGGERAYGRDQAEIVGFLTETMF